MRKKTWCGWIIRVKQRYYQVKRIMPPSDYHNKEASYSRQIRGSISRINADSKGEKGGTNLAEYFGALKDSPLLDMIEADAKMVRKMAKPRSEPAP